MGSPTSTLQPPPYLVALVEYLRREEAESWRWFSSVSAKTEYAEALRLELLKRAYRLDPATHAAVFEAARAAAAALGVTVPVFLYQEQGGLRPNAALYRLPGEAHIVFSGPVLQLLDAAELRTLLGHEFAHFRLWTEADGSFEVADRLVDAAALDPRADAAHRETARRLRLYTEIYADRGGALAAGEAAPAISTLVKIETGLTLVDPKEYRRQADEIFARQKIRTEGLSHPEAFIRARAVALWCESADPADVEAEVTRMIEGAPSIDTPDLLTQVKLQDWTRRWVNQLLRPEWFRTDLVRAQGRLLFGEFDFAASTADDPALFAALESGDNSVRDYFCYLTLDFAAADPELEEEPLRAALALLERLGWAARFETIAAKELKLKRKDLQKLRAVDAARDEATRAGSESEGTVGAASTAGPATTDGAPTVEKLPRPDEVESPLPADTPTGASPADPPSPQPPIVPSPNPAPPPPATGGPAV